MFFNGDIIITDPCYIIKENRTKEPSMADYPILVGKSSKPFTEFTPEENAAYKELEAARERWEEENQDDWEACDYGSYMEALGIHTYLTNDTLYGDWSCHTFEEGTDKVLGQFCADAGLVSVFLLSEVLAYNPDFDYHLNRPWTTTLIKGFVGDIDIDTVPCSWKDEDGEVHDDEEVRVIGSGNINFYTKQTGF